MSHYNLRKRKRHVEIFFQDPKSEESSSEGSSDSPDESLSESSEECFDLDSILIGTVVNRMKNRYGDDIDLSDSDLRGIVSNAIKDSANDILEEYPVKPGDKTWKLELTQDEIDVLEPKLRELREEIEHETPTMADILRSNIPKSEKKKIIQQYDIMKNTDPYTPEMLNSIHNITKRINNETFFNTRGISVEEFEEKDKALKAKITQNDIELKARIFNLDTDESTKVRIYTIYTDMTNQQKGSSEYANLRQKLMWTLSLPYRRLKITDMSTQSVSEYCNKVYESLNSKLYGLYNIKEKLMHIVNNRIYNPKTKAMLALEGGPGLGKTAIASALAESLDLPFERISLGGMTDPSVLKGSDGVWVGAEPSIILQILKRMTYANGIILFDEVDKLSGPKGKAVQNALLHITDYTQNGEFQDLYLNDFSHDLSSIWFMFAMNNSDWISPIFRDRLWIEKVNPYHRNEKIKIIQIHLLPKILKSVGLEKDTCSITEKACIRLIESNETDSIRPLERYIADIVSKLNMLRSRLGAKNTFDLSYDLPDFTGFPYVITDTTVDNLTDIIPRKFNGMYV